MKNNLLVPVFEGIDAPTTTPVPDAYFDQLFPTLGKGPLKVLLYLVRRTFGFKKDGDHISLSQICTGIRRRDGSVLDRGTGLTRSSSTAAIRELEARHVIVATRGTSASGDAAVTHYALHFRERLSVADIITHTPPRDEAAYFPGIDSPNTTPVPDIYFDQLLPDLGLAECRLLLYVVRRTLGFKKLADAISFDQFVSGIVTREGTRLDYGAGLARSAVNDAITSLIMRHVIVRQRVRDAHNGDSTSIYALKMQEDALASLRSSLSLTPGAFTTCTTMTPFVQDADCHGVGVGALDHPRPDDDKGLGVAQINHPGVVPQDHSPQHHGTHADAPEQRCSNGGVERRDRPGVGRMDHREYLRATTRGTVSPPPVVQVAYPQETDTQQTEQQERQSQPGAYDALVRQISADLGLVNLASTYARRITELGQRKSLETFALCSLMMEAWTVTQVKLRDHALTQDGAAMAYFFRVLLEKTEDTRVESSTNDLHADDGTSLQSSDFIAQISTIVGPLPPQDTWQGVLSGCRDTMTPSNFARWLVCTVLIEESTTLVVAVADTFQRDWLTTRLYSALRRNAHLFGEDRQIRFVVADEAGTFAQ